LFQIQLSWHEKAACKGKRDLFFGPYNERVGAKIQRERQAKRICRECPVISECRSYARQNSEFGIWGGETEEERCLAGYPIGDPLIRRKVSKMIKYNLNEKE
jgi:WhiB family redox-sensing transcriptional regulator